ncbi:T9SS type A sorting domain-containing protein [Hymenobacter busanensis]|uniref:T9SS type A sorting domain-containing protein n=1 Tax=Hymenobacter busanensis TaxID=2607656 RepID=A0A7L4ZY61_9BACT|nr:T9SS type A sorting domain-containing protein [Hymenobacter busanensis]KAA9331283.1 T9SS type A sorting domain-containing protein [Hymenobacter busanensis]QHJ08434.1 T9SS type A sorting domain-containing protein [Hymenobacter busanensis]
MKKLVFPILLSGFPLLGFAQSAPATAKSALISGDSAKSGVVAPTVTFSLEANPVNNSLRVRTNAKGPMSLEINDTDGRPVFTKSLSATGAPMTVPLGKLSGGTYVVRCTVADKVYMRRMTLGQ